jgi:hypothetical protein
MGADGLDGLETHLDFGLQTLYESSFLWIALVRVVRNTVVGGCSCFCFSYLGLFCVLLCCMWGEAVRLLDSVVGWFCLVLQV